MEDFSIEAVALFTNGRLKEALGEPLGVRQLQPPRAARRRPSSMLPLQARALLRGRVPGPALEEGRPQAVLRGPGPAEASARGEGGCSGSGADLRDLYRNNDGRRYNSFVVLARVSHTLCGWVASEFFDSSVHSLPRGCRPHPTRRKKRFIARLDKG